MMGCSRDQTPILERLAAIEQKIDSLNSKLAASPPVGRLPKRAAQAEQNPDTVYAIPVDGLPFKGSADAKVTIVKAFEFACPACEGARAFDHQLIAALGDRVKLAYKNYVVHPGRAEIPAYAACAANLQGKYFEMADLIWDNGFKARDLGRDNMLAQARTLGLDTARFEKDMDGACKQVLARDQSQLRAIGTRGTPTYYVNGRTLTRRSVDGVRALVDEEVEKAEQRIAGGTPAADYYAEWVVKKGKKTL